MANQVENLPPQMINLWGHLYCQSAAIPSEKRFIMFDQTGDESRVFFHPWDMKNSFPVNQNLPPQSAGAGFNPFLEEKCAMASAMAALQSMRSSRGSSFTLCEMGPLEKMAMAGFGGEKMAMAGIGKTGEEKTAMGNENFAGRSHSRSLGRGKSHSRSLENGYGEEEEGSSSFMQENTEDLEALLSSDDEESSTGHSPSDLTCQNHGCGDEEDEVGSVQKSFRCKNFDNGEVNFVPSHSRAAAATEPKSESLVFCETGTKSPVFSSNLAGPAISETSSSTGVGSAIAGRVRSENFVRIPVARSSGLLKNRAASRKEKIKQTVRLLRSLIPGGDCMDACVVLDEAIHYVRALQLKVLKLESSKNSKF